MSSDQTLLPPNATPLERALVRAAARATDLDIPIRDLWSVDNCPERLLPWLAWALAIQTWRSDWPVSLKRSRIRTAIEIHRRRGTARSVRTVVESFGADLALREWWETTPRGTPHTFIITLSLGDLPRDAQYQADIAREIDLVRPERSHYSLVAATELDARIGIIATARTVVITRLTLTE